MTVIDVIKKHIQNLYETNPNVHVNITIPHTRIQLQNDPAVLKGAYRHVFLLEERSSGIVRSHTVKYADLVTKQIEIVELQNLGI